MRPEPSRSAAIKANLDAAANLRLRMRFALACAQRIPHLIIDDQMLSLFGTGHAVANSKASECSLVTSLARKHGSFNFFVNVRANDERICGKPLQLGARTSRTL
jgi:hypothetical protein